jgi:hypothetical protein
VKINRSNDHTSHRTGNRPAPECPIEARRVYLRTLVAVPKSKLLLISATYLPRLDGAEDDFKVPVRRRTGERSQNELLRKHIVGDDSRLLTCETGSLRHGNSDCRTQATNHARYQYNHCIQGRGLCAGYVWCQGHDLNFPGGSYLLT